MIVERRGETRHIEEERGRDIFIGHFLDEVRQDTLGGHMRHCSEVGSGAQSRSQPCPWLLLSNSEYSTAKEEKNNIKIIQTLEAIITGKVEMDTGKKGEMDRTEEKELEK
ncbi:hypothetical protein Tco_0064780 [Tanacetum coccineum]